MLPEGSVMLVDGGATLVFRHDGRVETRKGRGSNSEYPTCHAMCRMPVGSPTSQLSSSIKASGRPSARFCGGSLVDRRVCDHRDGSRSSPRSRCYHPTRIVFPSSKRQRSPLPGPQDRMPPAPGRKSSQERTR
jgi:hypothetical protein